MDVADYRLRRGAPRKRNLTSGSNCSSNCLFSIPMKRSSSHHHHLSKPAYWMLFLIGLSFVHLSSSATDMESFNCDVGLRFQVSPSDKTARLLEFSNLKALEMHFKDRLPDKLRLHIFAPVGVGSITLALEKNWDIGGSKSLDPAQLEKMFCFYHGYAVDQPSSHAAFNLCRGKVGGTVLVNEERWIFESDPDKPESVQIFRGEDYLADKPIPTCDFPSVTSGKTPASDDVLEIFTRKKRQALRQGGLSVKELIDHRMTPKYYKKYLDGKIRYMELVLVADYSMFRKFEEDEFALNHYMGTLANILNSLYYPLNIRIALIDVQIWKDGDKSVVSQRSGEALTNFMKWRKDRLNKQTPNDNAQLVTNVKFEEGVVGKGNKGSMCTDYGSGGVSRDHSRRSISVAATIAHEMGHNFDMNHDTADECPCPLKKGCVMAPATSWTAPTLWSECSLKRMTAKFNGGLDFCLWNKPAMPWKGGPVCGNGFLEPGEDCDCGWPAVCQNKCCNPWTCKITNTSQCAEGECCDKSTCQLKQATTTCRGSSNQCDLPEFCDGKTAQCPNDVHKHDGVSCSEGFCAHGKCGSRNGGCRALWGPTGRNPSDVCYELNQKGNRYGNCGKNSHHRWVKCQSEEDRLCGRLHCDHSSGNSLPDGFHGSRVSSHSTRLPVGSFTCRTIQVDEINPDPGMVPDGASCGANKDKICFGAQCLDRSVITAKLPCSTSDCNANGVCNSLGHCHCWEGYGWDTDCRGPGSGGSQDSGPMSTGSAFNLTLALCIFIPLLIILAGVITFVYRKKPHLLAKYRLTRLLLPKKEARQHRAAAGFTVANNRRTGGGGSSAALAPKTTKTSGWDSGSSTPRSTHRLEFKTGPPPINAKPIGRDDISPPVPLGPPPASYASNGTLNYQNSSSGIAPSYNSSTLPVPKHHGITAAIQMWDDTATGGTSATTLNRQPSVRPLKPAPPPPVAHLPNRPTTRPKNMDVLYGERGAELGISATEPKGSYGRDPSDDMGLVSELRSALKDYDSRPLPQPARRAPPPPCDPLPGAGHDDMQRGRATPPPEDPKVPWSKRGLERSVSGGSSSSGGKSRPTGAPPPPPPSKALKPNLYKDDENVYDDIADYAESKPPLPGPKPGSGPKPPLPSKKPLGPPPKPASGQKVNVSALKAKFDQSSGDVKTEIVK